MSDAEVLRVIEEMETQIHAESFSMDPGAIQDWQRRFQVAVASAERGPEWPGIVQKAQLIQGALERTLAQVIAKRDDIKREMETQAKGNRALNAYRHEPS